MTPEIRADTPRCDVVGEACDEAVVVSCTAALGGPGKTPSRAVVSADLPDGRRVLRVHAEPELAQRITQEELCGHLVHLEAGSVRA